MIIITIMFDNGSSNNNGYNNGYSNGYGNGYGNGYSNGHGHSNSNSNSNGHGHGNTTTGSIITSSTRELFTTQRTYHQQFTAASRLQSATAATAARTSHY